jgi:hypothetical protein
MILIPENTRMPVNGNEPYLSLIQLMTEGRIVSDF